MRAIKGGACYRFPKNVGLYHSGGYDSAFKGGPIEDDADFAAVKSESDANGQLPTRGCD
jgi:hypothetical protein